MKNFIYLILILVLASVLLNIKLEKKFIGHHDWNGVWYGTIARNNLRYGLVKTKLGSVGGNQIEQITPNMFFIHYPPLFPIILSVGFILFGQSEMALRLIIIFFSLNTIIFIYLIANKLFNRNVAFLAGLFTTITPLFIYFGKLPVHEPILLPIALVCIYLYIVWSNSQKTKHLILLIFFLVVGELISWPAYFIPPLLAVHYYFFHKSKTKIKFILFFFILPIILFILYLLHMKFVSGAVLSHAIINIFTTRISSSLTTQIYQLTPAKIFLNEIRFILIYFTKIILLFSLIWIIRLFVLVVLKIKISFENGILLLFLVFGSAYILIFQEAAFIHDYLIYYLLPFIVISSAIVFDYLIKLIPNKAIRSIFILVIILLISTERIKYTKALIDSNNSEKGYVLGKFINSKSTSSDRIFVGSNFYNQFFSPFISYYSNRNVSYGESIDKTELNNYELIIRPRAHDALDEYSKKILNYSYKRNEDNNFIWYYTKLKQK